MRKKRLWLLMKLVIKKDRVSIFFWTASIVFFNMYVTIAFPKLFPTQADILAITTMLENPAMQSMLGPLYGGPDYTYGALHAAEMLLFSGLAIAVMNILMITQHTRRDEEDGLHELIQSLPVNKLKPLIATLITYSMVNLFIGVLTGLAMSFAQVKSMDLAGCMIYGLSLSSVGISFMATTALIAQLSRSSRGTMGLSFFVLGFQYLMRGIGDVGVEVLSLMTPLGLMMRTKSFVDNQVWPILLILFISAIQIFIAIKLCNTRDLDAGFLPERKGRTEAQRYMLNPFGFIVRLQKNSLIVWGIFVLMLGASYGSVLGDIDTFLVGNDMYAQLISSVGGGESLTDQFISLIQAVVALFGTIPVIQVILRLRKEEKKGRLEHILTRGVSRNRLHLSYIILALFTSVLMAFLGSFGLYISGAATTEGLLDMGTMITAGFAYLPAMWVMVGVAGVFIGYAPRWTSAVWLYLTYTFISIYFGGILNFPEWMSKLSPFGHIPQLPVDKFSWTSVIIISIIAIILNSLGVVMFSRRSTENPV